VPVKTDILTEVRVVPNLYVSRISLAFVVRSNILLCSNIQKASRHNSDTLHNAESTCVVDGTRQWLCLGQFQVTIGSCIQMVPWKAWCK